VTLAPLRPQGWSSRAITRLQGRSPSTISRELRRNACNGSDASAPAQRLCQQRRIQARPCPKLHSSGALWMLVTTMLCWLWSPQQIARTLQRMYPQEPSMHASHESIYTAIYAYPRGELRRQLIALLRQGKSTRRPRSAGSDRRGQIPDMVSIHVRPPEVNDRVMPGHWEGDLIKGAGNKSAVGVLVERSTRLVLLCKMPDASAESALAAFTNKLRQIADPMRQTRTYDQVKEMARHTELAEALGMRVYFCDPHSPWQRGSNENINGLIRQYLPKGTDLSVHSQEQLNAIALQLNMRPRKRFDFKCPIEVMGEVMQEALAMRHDAPASIQ